MTIFFYLLSTLYTDKAFIKYCTVYFGILSPRDEAKVEIKICSSKEIQTSAGIISLSFLSGLAFSLLLLFILSVDNQSQTSLLVYLDTAQKQD